MNSARQRIRRTLAGGLCLALLLTGFLDIAILSVPIYDMQLYDRILQSRNMSTLYVLSVACAAGLVMCGLLDYLRSACLIAIGEAMGRHLNGAVLQEGVRRAAAGDRVAGPELLRDLNELQGFLSSGAVAVPLDALCAPLFLAVMFLLHPAFGYLGIAGISLLILTGLLAEWLIRPALLAAQKRRVEAGQVLARNLSEPELADGLGMLPAIARKWAVRHGQALAELDRVGGHALAIGGLSRLIRLLLQATVMIVGACLVLAGATTPGSLMGSNLLTSKLLVPFDQLVGSWRHWALAHAAWGRINRLLETVPDDFSAVPATAQGAPMGLVVQDASLNSADGRVLLHGIDLSIPPGALVVVTGPNGAGKTTLLRLLAGLVPPTTGAVLLDGVPVYGGGGVGFLPQSVALLDGSVAENIARFQHDGLGGAVAAARLADLHELIGRLHRGYDTPLSRSAATLSGGMRQRVGLARAIFGSPRLLILDEPDASLDREGTDALLRALRACCDAGTVAIVTSHRPGLPAAADRVVTLQSGTITPPATAGLLEQTSKPVHLAIA